MLQFEVKYKFNQKSTLYFNGVKWWTTYMWHLMGDLPHEIWYLQRKICGLWVFELSNYSVALQHLQTFSQLATKKAYFYLISKTLWCFKHSETRMEVKLYFVKRVGRICFCQLHFTKVNYSLIHACPSLGLYGCRYNLWWVCGSALPATIHSSCCKQRWNAITIALYYLCQLKAVCILDSPEICNGDRQRWLCQTIHSSFSRI